VAATPAQCSTCMDGYYKEANNTCSACNVLNCEKCSGIDKCSSCKETFIPSLNNGDVCISCGNVIPGCSSCKWSIEFATSNSLKCDTCMTGYVLLN